ncbi:MAG TPA: hypothetical protein PKN13_11860 [Accumulibacter sp.]|nr:hypothetical protein [Accumulibacter sp.]HMW17919.1 hypothetical protein [Accumulibacter sp.]HNC16798.1 hypothetical protein [Accumulibacter sp.]HND80492.1 hypothetical protein [Accumulibacter sp.]HNE13688.1 hypothetical protein [Accumulibacter sp.]
MQLRHQAQDAENRRKRFEAIAQAARQLRFAMEGLNLSELHVLESEQQAAHQRYRFMAYAVEDTHPLVATLVKRLSAMPGRKLDIHVAKAGNFTAEVQRLARALWPDHGHAITATCFCHQWSADVKSTGDADAASRGLGHRSAKTRKYYGTAHQARDRHAVRPVQIEADLPVRALPIRARPITQAHINSKHAAEMG